MEFPRPKGGIATRLEEAHSNVLAGVSLWRQAVEGLENEEALDDLCRFMEAP